MPFRITGDKELAAALHRYADGAPRRLSDFALQQAQQVAKTAASRAPVRTGNLRRSIIAAAYQPQAAYATVTAPYAIYVLGKNPFLYDALEAQADRIGQAATTDMAAYVADTFKG